MKEPMKALLLQELPNGKIAIVEIEPFEVVPTEGILGTDQRPVFEYPSSGNLYGLVREFFKEPEPPVNPT